MVKIQTPYEKLSKAEAKRLNTIFKEKHGNISRCSELTNLTVNTLKRARDEREITSESAKAIREKLLSEQLETA